MKTEDKKPKNLAIPGKPMSKEEFVSLIKEAEEGEFMSLDEFDKRFEEWRLNRK
ncbi:hypothetical protein [Flavobacterium ardleyense]|uniref:hypothetical protein n=1 Tax=Flavobacterium ardleyense TaxID=2038737 RepID=UPI00298D5D3C|nr:hypothetical protein [Flavobacterium ardleyense]